MNTKIKILIGFLGLLGSQFMQGRAFRIINSYPFNFLAYVDKDGQETHIGSLLRKQRNSRNDSFLDGEVPQQAFTLVLQPNSNGVRADAESIKKAGLQDGVDVKYMVPAGVSSVRVDDIVKAVKAKNKKQWLNFFTKSIK